MSLPPRPLLPAEVAERWGCSERTVRNMVRDGQLKHFRLGGRLLRIPLSAVEEVEACGDQAPAPIKRSVPAPPASTLAETWARAEKALSRDNKIRKRGCADHE